MEKATPSLSPQELRENLVRLVELEALRSENQVYRSYIQREAALATKEQANSDKALALANQATELAKRETELERKRADFYKNAYETVTKGRSKGCWVAKVLTIGLARCK